MKKSKISIYFGRLEKIKKIASNDKINESKIIRIWLKLLRVIKDEIKNNGV